MDRFRDLERAGETGRKDAALLAAIAGFEALKHPTSHNLRQFSNLFTGLFELTREDTRRTAAAALSRIEMLPQDVTMIVANQPIRIAAPFLAFSPCLTDQMLLQTISRHGNAHARAISRRKSLSPVLLGVLAELNDSAVARSIRLRHMNGNKLGAKIPMTDDAVKRRDEDALRKRIKDMALARMTKSSKPATQSATMGRPALDLLVQQAEASQPVRFSGMLARALGTEASLAERIMLDVSGRQLTMALQALNMADDEILRVLVSIFPQLRRLSGGIQHASLVLQSTNRDDSTRRVTAWVRANAPKARQTATHFEPHTVDNPERIDRSAPGYRNDRAVKPAAIKPAVKRA
ncbi:DUF2336 domain-containing protein [Hoeflea sp. TYP-13]|uniref:DUF2336 domain-containing protein n=1 Tax=Hoeflea sp. TYP-13 TaxID=3230023 RepID=UPI0034C6DD0B